MSSKVKVNENDELIQAELSVKINGPDVLTAVASNKRIGIVRYLQIHPMEDKTVEKLLKKTFAKDAYTESEWVVVIEEFLNS